MLLTAQEQRAISLLPGIVFRPHPEGNAGNHAMRETGRNKTHKLSGWEAVLGGVSSSKKKEITLPDFSQANSIVGSGS